MLASCLAVGIAVASAVGAPAISPPAQAQAPPPPKFTKALLKLENQDQCLAYMGGNVMVASCNASDGGQRWTLRADEQLQTDQPGSGQAGNCAWVASVTSGGLPVVEADSQCRPDRPDHLWEYTKNHELKTRDPQGGCITPSTEPPLTVTDQCKGAPNQRWIVTQLVDLQIQLRVPAAGSVGGDLHYTVKVNNAGPEPVKGAKFKHVVPSQLRDSGWTCTRAPDPHHNGCRPRNNSTENNEPLPGEVSLEPGETDAFDLSAKVDSSAGGSTVPFEASIAVPAPSPDGTTFIDTNPTNNRAACTKPPVGCLPP